MKTHVTDSAEARKAGIKVLKNLGWPLDSGFADMDSKYWDFTTEHLFGQLWSRPGLSLRDRAIVTRLNEEMRKVLSAGDLREKWAPQGMEIIDATPPQIEKMIRDEHERMGKIIKQTGIRLE